MRGERKSNEIKKKSVPDRNVFFAIETGWTSNKNPLVYMLSQEICVCVFVLSVELVEWNVFLTCNVKSIIKFNVVVNIMKLIEHKDLFWEGPKSLSNLLFVMRIKYHIFNSFFIIIFATGYFNNMLEIFFRSFLRIFFLLWFDWKIANHFQFSCTIFSIQCLRKWNHIEVLSVWYNLFSCFSYCLLFFIDYISTFSWFASA